MINIAMNMYALYLFRVTQRPKKEHCIVCTLVKKIYTCRIASSAYNKWTWASFFAESLVEFSSHSSHFVGLFAFFLVNAVTVAVIMFTSRLFVVNY